MTDEPGGQDHIPDPPTRDVPLRATIEGESRISASLSVERPLNARVASTSGVAATAYVIPAGPLLPDLIHSGDVEWTDGALAQLVALRAQHPSDRRGRPSFYPEHNEAGFFGELCNASHAAVRDGKHVNYTTLRDYGLAGSRKTAGDAVKRFKYDLTKIESEALQCTNRLNSCALIWRRRAEFKENGAYSGSHER